MTRGEFENFFLEKPQPAEVVVPIRMEEGIESEEADKTLSGLIGMNVGY